MSNDNFSSSTPSPYLPEPASGQETLRPATPIVRTDQFLPEHVDISDDLDRQDSTSQSNLSNVTDTAKDLAQEGQHAATEVLDTAKQEASLIGEQAKEQAADLFAELSSDLREQASLQQQKVATNLRDISDEFRHRCPRPLLHDDGKHPDLIGVARETINLIDHTRTLKC